jgi:hypothetical protein
MRVNQNAENPKLAGSCHRVGNTRPDAMAAAPGRDVDEAIGPGEALHKLMKRGRLCLRLRENSGQAWQVRSQPREIGRIRRDHWASRE